jgi:hypothetical protein
MITLRYLVQAMHRPLLPTWSRSIKATQSPLLRLPIDRCPLHRAFIPSHSLVRPRSNRMRLSLRNHQPRQRLREREFKSARSPILSWRVVRTDQYRPTTLRRDHYSIPLERGTNRRSRHRSILPRAQSGNGDSTLPPSEEPTFSRLRLLPRLSLQVRPRLVSRRHRIRPH